MSAPTSNLDSAFIEFQSAVTQLWTKPNDRDYIKLMVKDFWEDQLLPAERQRVGQEAIDLMQASQRAREITEAQDAGPQWRYLENVFGQPVGYLSAKDVALLLDHMAVCRAIHQRMLRYLAALSVFKETLEQLGLDPQTREACEAEADEHTAMRDQATDRIDILKQQLELHGVSCPENEERWIVAKQLDNYKIVLQVLCDGNGNVTDRRIRKEEDLGTFDGTGLKFWKDDLVDGVRVPNEWYLQNKCWQRSTDNVVRLTAYSVNQGKQSVTYYICYCPHGDLDTIFSSYPKDQGQVIPEPVLWYIFLRLSQACLIMERGGYAFRQPGWLEIVHRDIKCANIFLDPPTRNFFPAYPTPKMADFGFAIETHAQDDNNPQLYAEYGTEPYFAPEQIRTVLPDPTTAAPPTGSHTTPYKLLSPTNIWAIGIVMVELTLGEYMDEKEQKQYKDGPEQTTVSAYAREHYSQELIDVIHRCVAYYPDRRPTARELYGLIRDRMTRVPQARYMHDASRGRQEEGGEMGWKIAKEKYVLDLAM